MWVCQTQNTKKNIQVEYLFYEAHASPAIRDMSGDTPLAYAKTYSRDKATIDLLRRCTPLNNDIKKAVEQGLEH
jgi:hypothetical protein